MNSTLYSVVLLLLVSTGSLFSQDAGRISSNRELRLTIERLIKMPDSAPPPAEGLPVLSGAHLRRTSRISEIGNYLMRAGDGNPVERIAILATEYRRVQNVLANSLKTEDVVRKSTDIPSELIRRMEFYTSRMSPSLVKDLKARREYEYILANERRYSELMGWKRAMQDLSRELLRGIDFALTLPPFDGVSSLEEVVPLLRKAGLKPEDFVPIFERMKSSGELKRSRWEH